MDRRTVKGMARREKIVSWLRENEPPQTLRELARRFGVSERTIRDDILMLEHDKQISISSQNGILLASTIRVHDWTPVLGWNGGAK